MALDDILSAIRSDADAELAQLARETDELCAALLTEAEEKAEHEEAASRQRVERRAEEVLRRLEIEADEAAMALRRSARERVLLLALAELRQRLAAIRDEGERYRRVWSRLARECLEALPDAKTVRVDPRDEGLAREALAGEGLTVEPTLSCWGGMEMDAGDGRRVYNSLESRLAAVAGSLRQVAASHDAVLGEMLP